MNGPLLNAIQALNRIVTFTDKKPDGVTALCSTRWMSKQINWECENSSTNRQFSFAATKFGKVNYDDFQAPACLSLRIGSPVILLNNQRACGGLGYSNGDFAKVIDIDEDSATVTVELEGNRGTEVIQKHTWIKSQYVMEEDPVTGQEKLRLEQVGWYKQLPLMLAHAITIHKSQGMTLSKAHIDFANGAFAPGQGYVALSRVKSLRNITTSRPFTADDFITCPVTLKRYASYQYPTD